MNDTEIEEAWESVREALEKAKGMYWDGCHKIYIAMDDEEVAKMKEYGYEYHKPNFDELKDWFDKSCGLKFVSAVYYNEEDPNAGYVNLIPQFAFEDDEDYHDIDD